MRFPCLKVEGGLLAADLLDRIYDGTAPGQAAADFSLSGRLENEIASAWQEALEHWEAFQHRLERLPESDVATTVTRDQWVIPLLSLLGYELVYTPRAAEIEGKTYAISHRAGTGEGAPPVHIVGCRQALDRRPESGRPRLAPHSLVQEYLNRSEHLWGVVTNGFTLRLLRQTGRLTRPTYIEFDLREMLSGRNFADFTLFYRLAHRSRLPQEGGEECWLERYYQETIEQGGRVRDRLRDGVEKALQILGWAFLEHPANEALREKVRTGELTAADYYQELLRLIYRILFLLVAEERELLTTDPIYRQHYSVGRLRGLCENRRAYSDYTDLWENAKTTFRLFSDESLGAKLALPPLNGPLFDPQATADLNDLKLTNRAFLEAFWYLSMYQENERAPWRRVNYAALDVEELGSVYESLLDYHPDLKASGSEVAFSLLAGTERKSTGSYYTPRALVEELVNSALVPVMQEKLAGKKTQAEKETALLSLKVCDPACGSGHFLLAAARRLGLELARLRSEADEPSPEEVREAVREVITHCLYGVDKNPMAVELCKVALWIEGQVPGKPLTFLDHRIRCGDSLVGVFDLAVLEKGIPDEAYVPMEGDDKAVARSLVRKNKEDRSGQMRLHFPAPADPASLLQETVQLLALPDDTPEVVRQKTKAYQNARREGSPLWRKLTACHLWTAAFFARLDQGVDQVPLSGDLEAFLSGREDPRLINDAWHLARKHRFFHWPLEFPEVFAEGGFDVVLCNPPWERIKLQEEEFFATRDQEIATALNKAARRQLINALRATNPALWEEYQEAKHTAEAQSKFLRGSGRFPLTARGDINTYSVFAELFARLIRSNGRAGVVLPTGIATDDTNKHFFAHLVETGRLASLYDFENREGIFPAVDSRYKFCLLTLKGADERKTPARFAFFLTRTEHLRDGSRVFELNPDDFALFNPNTRTCPVFRTRADAELTKKIYQRVPVLVNEETGENPWGIRFMTMFHMANDSHLFRTTEELKQEGYRLVRGRELGRPEGLYYVRKDEVWLPLYEAKMIWQFDHRFGTYEGVSPNISSTHLPTPREEEYADPHYFVLPRYWVREEEVVTRVTQVPRDIVRTFEFMKTAQLSDLYYREKEQDLIRCFLIWVAGYHLAHGKEKGWTILERVAMSMGSIWQSGLRDMLDWSNCLSAAKAWQRDFPLTQDDLRIMDEYFARKDVLGAAKAIIERRCPRWLLGFRDVTNATNERTAIFTVLPRVGVGNNAPLLLPSQINAFLASTLVGNLASIVFDYIARLKIAGTHMNFFFVKQLPVLPPDAYTESDLFFIVPRVLELVYNAWDLEAFAREVWQECPRELRKEIAHRWQECCGRAPGVHPDAEAILPFRWDPERRAIIRAELDAYYAKLYGLTQDELRYILDPKDVFGPDFPGETFRVLKEKEERHCGEYRTRRLVLEAWDRLEAERKSVRRPL